jgi:hypothetical protein
MAFIQRIFWFKSLPNNMRALLDKHDTVVFATENRATLCGTIWIIAPHKVARNLNDLV